MNEILATLLSGATMLALILGLSCIIMAVITTKNGSEALKERIEYGMFGVSGLAISILLVVASS